MLSTRSSAVSIRSARWRHRHPLLLLLLLLMLVVVQCGRRRGQRTALLLMDRLFIRYLRSDRHTGRKHGWTPGRGCAVTSRARWRHVLRRSCGHEGLRWRCATCAAVGEERCMIGLVEVCCAGSGAKRQSR